LGLLQVWFIDEFLAQRATLAATTVANHAAVAGK